MWFKEMWLCVKLKRVGMGRLTLSPLSVWEPPKGLLEYPKSVHGWVGHGGMTLGTICGPSPFPYWHYFLFCFLIAMN